MRIMKKSLFLVGAFMAFTAIALTSCVVKDLKSLSSSDDPIVRETRPISGFEMVEINGSPTVYYTQADSFSVIVKGPEKMIENILTEVKGDTLEIRNRGKYGVVNFMFTDSSELSVHVTSPDLTGIHLNGSGDFISRHRIDSDVLNIELKGSGDINVKDIICDKCQISLKGSGDIDVDRLESKEVEASLIGSGDVELKLYNVDSTILSLKGSGDISSHFEEGCKRLECNLNGSGEISLSGEIEHFKNQKNGSGEVDIHKLAIEK